MSTTKNTNMTVKDGDIVEFNNANIPNGGWRNFSGGPTRFDPSNTKRYFEIFLTDDEAKILEAHGYNVKYLTSENQSEPSQAHLKVSVKFSKNPRYNPRIWQVRNSGRPVLLPEDLLEMLDTADFVRVKLQIRPYDWEYGSRTGRSAEVKQMYVAIAEDEFGSEFYPEEDEEVPFA